MTLPAPYSSAPGNGNGHPHGRLDGNGGTNDPIAANDPIASNGASIPPPNLAATQPDALLHLRAAVQSGLPWPQALLAAIALWTLPRETYQGRTYRYLIHGAALDWLTLAERLALEIPEFIPPPELETLLFTGALPAAVTPDEFRERIGGHKYRAYLNYWYGVIVEEALQQAVEDDVRKRQLARCYPDGEDLVEEAFTHLYGQTRAALLKEYRRQAGLGPRAPLSLADWKEFTYQLAQRRYQLWDPARVASDTRKGIHHLEHLEQTAAIPPVAELAAV